MWRRHLHAGAAGAAGGEGGGRGAEGSGGGCGGAARVSGRVEAAPARQALHAVEAVEAEAVRAREEVRVREQLEAALAPQQLVHRAAEHVFGGWCWVPPTASAERQLWAGL